MLRMRAFDLIHCSLISNGFFFIVVVVVVVFITLLVHTPSHLAGETIENIHN